MRGGNSLQEQLQRRRVLDCARWKPTWTHARIVRELARDVPPLHIGKATVSRILRSGVTTVNTHGGHNRHSAALRRDVVRLLRGRLPIVNGLRSQRHSIPQVLSILNDDQKGASVICESSVRDIAKSAGLVWTRRNQGPAITHANRADRRAFHDRMVGRSPAEWRCVVWTDSHAIDPCHVPNRHNDGVWRFIDDPDPPSFQRHRRPDSTLHCYGALCKFGLIGPIFIKGSITAARYLEEVLQPLIGLVADQSGAEPFLWQQDGAGAHRANIVQKWLRDSDYDFIPKEHWPGNSADLNIIEPMWVPLQQHCARPGERNVPEATLKRRARAFYRSTTAEECIIYLDSAPKRLVLLQKSDYWAIAK